MEKLTSALQDLELQMRNMQGHLRGLSWPSESLQHMANDVIVWLGLGASAVEGLRTVLGPTQEAAPVAEEIKEEEEGGEVPSEPVQQPEGGEAGDEVPILKPEAKPPESRKRVRKRKG